MNKKVKIILSISLVINLLFLSFHLGHVFGFLKPPHPARIHGREMFKQREQEIISAVSVQGKQPVRETFEKLNESNQVRFEKMRDEMDEVEKIVDAEDFDKNLFLEKFKKIRQKSQKIKDKNIELIAEGLSKLNQNDRKKIVEIFKNNRSPFSPKEFKGKRNFRGDFRPRGE